MRFDRQLLFWALLAATLGPAAIAKDEDLVLNALQQIDAEIKPGHYQEKRFDLDGDGAEDVLALMNGGSGYCGSGGCTLFVLRALEDKFAKVGAIGVVNPPISVRKTSHHGMRDLLVRVRGGGATPHFATLAFDGQAYPLTPDEKVSQVAETDHLLFKDPEQKATPEADDQEPPPPARLKPEDLAGLDELPEPRRKLVEAALELGREHHLNKYLFGSADPERGGFDCSGAMFYVLQQAGLKPPRTSSGQFDWIKEAGTLVEVPATAKSLDDKIFSTLRPGDLLFWSGTYKPTDGRTNGITHVQMYLGKEKKDGRIVMIGSSDGRSYRRQRQCGYGVFDFRLPAKGSKSRFAGFGPPPGLLPESK